MCSVSSSYFRDENQYKNHEALIKELKAIIVKSAELERNGSQKWKT